MNINQYSHQEIRDIWQKTCLLLEKQLTPAVFQTWIVSNPLVSLEKTNDSILATISSPTAFHATNLKRNLDQQISLALKEIIGESVITNYKVGSLTSSNSQETNSQSHYSNSTPRASSIQSPKASDLFSETTLKQSHEDKLLWKQKQLGLNPNFTFESFAVSSTNEMAHAAAVAVAQNPGSAYNPLFFYGSVGVGKTHLMHAVGNNVLSNNLDTRVVYCTGEEFTNQIVQAIQTKQAASFKNKYRSAQVLLIDDVQFIAGKNTVQEEFFHTFNALIQQHHQVILTSDRHPQSISLLEDRLRSRFEAGLMIDIGQPSFELRTAILLLKSRQAKVDLSIDLAKRVAETMEGARQIEGFISLIKSEVELKGKEVNSFLIDQLLSNQPFARYSSQQNINTSPSEVIRVISKYFDIKQTELRGKSRQKNFVFARHLTMYILKEDLKLPLVEIGRWLANRDHTSVIHGLKRINQEIKYNEQLKNDIKAIRGSLSG